MWGIWNWSALAAPRAWSAIRQGRRAYRERPEIRDIWGGPFNGQEARRALFDQLVAAVDPAAIVETGTFRGVTTEYLAGAGRPVHTIELSPSAFGYSGERFADHNVKVKRYLGDSRVLLRWLLARRLSSAAPVLFYLDAHGGGQELPLAAEIELIAERSPKPVIMIDDFAVPHDAGYRYDDYGPGKVLDHALIAPLLERFRMAAFYPATPSAAETGMRRGCVVLARDQDHVRALSQMPALVGPAHPIALTSNPALT